ncbi:MAG: hypothetical protein R2844_19830 [Caldilineales bacterium]
MRGGFAEFTSEYRRNLVAVPDGFPMKQANGSAHGGCHHLAHAGDPRPAEAETVLIVGAGGGVNSLSIPLAKMLGATVWVVADGCANGRRSRRPSGRRLGHRPRG